MTKGFDQQHSPANSPPTKSAPAPQHGQKSGEVAQKVVETRAFMPRPAH